MTQESANDAREAYVSILGFLSEDAQAALFRYLPYLQECVDNEVAAFGEKLTADLVRRAAGESVTLSKDLEQLAEQASCAVKLANESENLPRDVSEKIGGVAQAAEDFDKKVSESTALLRRVQALGHRVAEVSKRGTADGLRWALEDVKESHESWWRAVRGDKADSPLAAALDDITERFKELEQSFERTHKEATAEEESGTASATREGDVEEATVGADDSIGTVEGRGAEPDAGLGGRADDPIGTAEAAEASMYTGDRAGQASGPEVEDCVEELARSVWGLANEIQAAQALRVGELVKSVTGLRQQAALLSKWDDAADRLRQSAEEANSIIDDAKGAFDAAVANGIKATHLDLLGGSDLGPERTQKRRGWRFWRRT